MVQAADDRAWQQLGEMLEHRRVEIDARYTNLTLFCAERGIDYRLCWDAEHAARVNYRRVTLAALERAYALDAWSIDAFLRTGIPLLAADANPYDDDPELAEVWARSRGLKPDARHGLVAAARQIRDTAEKGSSENGKPS